MISIFGAIAQLGERLLCTQEVSGSIPLSSTNFTEEKLMIKIVFIIGFLPTIFKKVIVEY